MKWCENQPNQQFRSSSFRSAAAITAIVFTYANLIKHHIMKPKTYKEAISLVFLSIHSVAVKAT
jgi:hypothetical protein